ncbi:MAG: phosphodiester glycosidase family protein [Clostridia bacterium]|nr:phosphodiester glycosidase family protein [Clostridia bacterium]
MKRSIKCLSLVMALVLMLAAFTMTFSVSAVEPITGADTVYSENIKLNGEDTGVTLTQMILTSGSKYSLSREGLVNVIDLNDAAGVTLKVLNGGSYNWSKATMGTSALKYNETHTDSTVIAAVNGDPWIVYHTDYDGDGEASTGGSVKHVSVSRGLQIIDGEIWATAQINDENNLAKKDNVERGTPASQGPVFAILSDGSYMIGKPNISIKLTNDTQSTTSVVQGINRLPAPNSIIIYNQRGGAESMAYEDAYELYIESSDTAFTLTGKVTGTVKRICESGDPAERPAITENTIVVSARGNSIKNLEGKYAVGDKVSFTCTVGSDAMSSSQKAKWPTVIDAIGGFFTLIENGRYTGQQGNKTKYPCSIVGLREDGSPLLISTTPSDDGTRSSCTMEDLSRMCEELGLKTAILFDGGGSTTMVTLSGDNLVRRSAAVDGANSVRAVINGLAVVCEGVDAAPGNLESYNTAFLPDPEGGYVPEEPDPEDSALKTTPSYSYRYIANTREINHVKYIELLGMRDPNYSSSWTADQKAASIKPAVITGEVFPEDNKVKISGWVFVNGGQGDLYWSVDGETWYPCTDTVRSNADDKLAQDAAGAGNLTSSHAANAVFTDATADLSAYAGQTVKLRFGVVAAGNTEKLLHFLTLENVAVPESETEAPTEAPTETPTEPETEAPTEEPIGVSTEMPTEAPTAAPTEPEVTEAPKTQEKKGCGASLAVSLVTLVTMAGGALILKKKEK